MNGRERHPWFCFALLLLLLAAWVGSYLLLRPKDAPFYTPPPKTSSMPVRFSRSSSYGINYASDQKLGSVYTVLYYLHIPLNAFDRRILGNPVIMEHEPTEMIHFDFGAQF